MFPRQTVRFVQDFGAALTFGFLLAHIAFAPDYLVPGDAVFISTIPSICWLLGRVASNMWAESPRNWEYFYWLTDALPAFVANHKTPQSESLEGAPTNAETLPQNVSTATLPLD